MPISQLTENIVYQMHITLFSVRLTPEINSRYPTISMMQDMLEISVTTELTRPPTGLLPTLSVAQYWNKLEKMRARGSG